MITDYRNFLSSKRRDTEPSGFTIDADHVNPTLFPWQRQVVAWACQQGRSALFAECGLGKTPMQLTWAEQVINRGQAKRILILCPLAVAAQTAREAEKFKINVQSKVVREGFEVDLGISICNYDRLDKMPIEIFDGVVWDESSILKSYTGQTKRKLLKLFRGFRHKLACTATPAPNDLLELGNHADGLDVMPSNEMISRWFINDTMAAGKYRLKQHAARDYWRWVTSWAMSISRPSDIGGDDTGFDLPPLNIHRVVIDAMTEPPAGMLFETGGVSATDIHREKRSTAELRAAEVAKLVNPSSDAWATWCTTNYEADEIVKAIPDAVDLRGSMSITQKEEIIEAFVNGSIRVLNTKASLTGFGVNWQHIHKTAVMGLTHSYEQFYQLVRRFWRFRQLHEVDCYLIETDGEAAISKVVFDKEKLHSQMKSGIIDAVREDQMRRLQGRRKLEGYDPKIEVEIPRWLKTKSTA